MHFCHPSQAVGRGGCVNPGLLRDALIAAGLLVPRGEHPRRHPRARDVAPRLEIDDLGRRVAAARIADELGRGDCIDNLESWLSVDLGRLMQRRGEP